MELIITEKDNAARRIAEILSGGDAVTVSDYNVSVYEWDDTRCIGLSGHVVSVDFPDEYNDWRDVEPAELIEAPIQKRVTRPDIVATVRRLAGEATRVVIATDYDREGELIGKEAFEIVEDVAPDVPVDRVRFSSITADEVRSAFDNRDEIDFDLAAAGEARQIIDLVWGAALTRYLSLSAGRLGDDFISVGRVQSPTLKLIVDREREIEAFDPETYWELIADLRDDGESFTAQYFYLDEDENEAERIWDGEVADEVYQAIAAASTATVHDVDERTRRDRPPHPFNTTQFIRAAGAIGYGAQRAMSIAEELYTAGYITYPRTDNTVYPSDLDPEALLETLADGPRIGEDAETLLEDAPFSPTRGDEETTDHPPIHPTPQIPNPADLSQDEWDVYELVVRRFYATLADPAIWKHLRVVAAIDDHRLKANGKRLVDAGYHQFYPYFSTDENIVPAVAEGQELAVDDVERHEKETQPPRRYGQSRLIETMEALGVGTKSTRHNVIEKLYNRGYVEDDPPRPTALAQAVVEASERFAELVTSEEMTAQLEEDMSAIANGEAELEDVTEESREILERVFDDLMESSEEVGELLRNAMRADRTVGPCPECGSDLLLRRSNRGSHFIGCDGYPDCEYTLPLPNRGEPLLLEDRCEEHELREVKMLAGRNTFVHGCPQCRADAASEEEDIVIGACPACGEEHGGELAIKRLRNGNRLVGCTRYPDCDYSLPLPRRGEIEIEDTRCEEHDLPELTVHNGDEPWELGCPICNFQRYQAQRNGDGSLTDLDGIGAKTADKLAEAGIESVEDLKTAEADEVAASVEGVSASRIREWQSEA